jgi:hypothetical protein
VTGYPCSPESFVRIAVRASAVARSRGHAHVPFLTADAHPDYAEVVLDEAVDALDADELRDVIRAMASEESARRWLAENEAIDEVLVLVHAFEALAVEES